MCSQPLLPPLSPPSAMLMIMALEEYGGGIESEHYRNLCDAVSDITLPQMHDRWSWSLNASGEFSVSSVQNIIDDVYLPKSEVATRWVKEVLIKINILAWKISLDRLPTRANFLAYGLEIPSILCPSCNEAVESSSHIFFSCSLSRQVMFKMCRWWDLNNSVISSYVEWLVWLSISRLSKHIKVIFEDKMTTLAEHIIVARAENRPPMLEKSMYDSWESRIRLFIKGKKHGRMMLDSIEIGQLVYPTVKENRQIHPKKYSELNEAQQLQDDCDV
ncbi:RNA-directed DNA polymerase, eukaryota [Tanacetum coccineum]